MVGGLVIFVLLFYVFSYARREERQRVISFVIGSLRECPVNGGSCLVMGSGSMPV